jgi:bifunctional DNase/RNase
MTTEAEPVDVAIESVRHNLQANRRVIVLQETVGERRYLPIWVDNPEGIAVALRLNEVAVPRPQTHDLMASLLAAADTRVREVVVERLQDDVFYASVAIDGPAGATVVDARPSDAVALAVRVGAPIKVRPEVLARAGVARAEGERSTAEEMAAQVVRLRELVEVLDAARVRFWLIGGWGVDFLAGRVTRSHGDVDAVAWLRSRQRLRRALTEGGYRIGSENEQVVNFVKGGQVASFFFLTRDADGRVAISGMPKWPWPDDALEERRRRLSGITCRVVGPRAMLALKESYPRPQRKSDREAIAALRALLGEG